MKNLNYLQKTLIIVTIIGFILCALVSYFVWKSDKNRQAYEDVQDKLNIVQNELDQTNNLLQKTQNDLEKAQENFQNETNKSIELSNELEQLNKDLTNTNIIIEDLKSDEYELVYMGEFRYTYYCNERYSHICGAGIGLTASGKPTEVGWTVAADTSVLPMGSIIYVEGVGFREVMDVGGGVNGNHIDILMNTHDECWEQTLVNGGIWMLIKKTP